MADHDAMVMVVTPHDTRSQDSDVRSDKLTRKQIVTIVILCYVNLINYMDRYTVSAILLDIQDTFHMTSPQAGLLQTAFILVYMVAAPVFGYLGDRFNRKYLMATGICIWSLSTLIGSFMPNYGSFLAMRCLVGIGEASYTTTSPTIISDMFVKDQRSKMLAIFNFAIPVGSGLGYMVGGLVTLIATNIMTNAGQDASEAWRWGLRFTPILGAVAVVLIVVVLEEPPRGEIEGGSHLKSTSFIQDLKYIFTNKSYILCTLGFTCVTFMAGALSWWGPSFVKLGIKIQEDPNLSEGAVDFLYGFLGMMAGLIGVPLGSYAGTKLRVKYPKADPLVCAFGLIVSFPLIIGCIYLAETNTIGSFAASFFGQVFLDLNWGIVADISLYVVIPTRRATAEALLILFSHAGGDAGSPYFLGLIADALVPSIQPRAVGGTSTTLGFVNTTITSLNTIVPLSISSTDSTENSTDQYITFKSIQYAFIICSLINLIGAVFFIWNSSYIEADKNECDRIIAGENHGDKAKNIKSTEIEAKQA